MRRALSLTAHRLLPRVSPLLALAIPSPSLCPSRHASHPALAEKLRREIEDEQQRADKPTRPETPKGWTLHKTPGSGFFKVTRTYEDEEITLVCHGEGIRADGDEDEDLPTVEIAVCIVQKGKAIRMNMGFQSGELVMDRMQFYDDVALATDESAEGIRRRESAYRGPKTDELNIEVYDALVNYLESRGITDELGLFMNSYAYWSEQAEYESWLQSVSRFVS